MDHLKATTATPPCHQPDDEDDPGREIEEEEEDDDEERPPHQTVDVAFLNQVDLVRSLYRQLFAQPELSPVVKAPFSYVDAAKLENGVNAPPSRVSTIRIEYCMNVRVDKDERIRIMRIIREKCSPSRQKGKRFKDSHDLTLVYEDIFVPKQITYAYKQSKPSCVLCNRIIPVGEPRCKYSIANALNQSSKCERCGTHVYCLPCFVVLESTVIPGAQCVCFGTLLSQRGGCRQVSLMTWR